MLRIRKLDERMLAIVSRELVAAERHYHRSCYHSYTRVKPTISSDTTNGEQDEYDVAEMYEKLFSYIQTELFINPEVLPITVLSKK